MLRRVIVLLLLLLQVCVAPVWAAQAVGESTPRELAKGSSARVVEVIDGDTVVLDNGKEVRLVGIQAPKLPLNRPNIKEWPLAQEAKAQLEKLVLNQRVTLSYGGARMDRHGRTLAHLHTDDGAWAQGEMLSRGLARVYTFADNRAAAPDLLALEAKAREAKRGIWALNHYSVQDADGKVGPPDTYQLVEGTVVEVADVLGKFFLNFGQDYKKDFTASISARDAKSFALAGMDLKSLNGSQIAERQARAGARLDRRAQRPGDGPDAPGADRVVR